MVEVQTLEINGRNGTFRKDGLYRSTVRLIENKKSSNFQQGRILESKSSFLV